MRKSLPFRPTAEIMIVDEAGNLVAKEAKTYIKYPGGGIDPGEDPAVGLRREVMEETGLSIGNIKLKERVKWDWPKTWPKSGKQKSRYQQFRGEDSHMYVGRVTGRAKPTSQEGDAWDNVPSTPMGEILRAHNSHGTTGFKKYKDGQRRVLKGLIRDS